MIEGAVPGHKGGWITVRDAVKKALPKEAPKPGKFKSPAAEAKASANEQAAAATPPADVPVEAAPKEGV